MGSAKLIFYKTLVINILIATLLFFLLNFANDYVHLSVIFAFEINVKITHK